MPPLSAHWSFVPMHESPDSAAFVEAQGWGRNQRRQKPAAPTWKGQRSSTSSHTPSKQHQTRQKSEEEYEFLAAKRTIALNDVKNRCHHDQECQCQQTPYNDYQ